MQGGTGRLRARGAGSAARWAAGAQEAHTAQRRGVFGQVGYETTSPSRKDTKDLAVKLTKISLCGAWLPKMFYDVDLLVGKWVQKVN